MLFLRRRSLFTLAICSSWACNCQGSVHSISYLFFFLSIGCKKQADRKVGRKRGTETESSSVHCSWAAGHHSPWQACSCQGSVHDISFLFVSHPLAIRNRQAERRVQTHGVTVSTSAFLACHQCYCAGLSLA